MESNSFSLVELTNINDDLLLPWLDLYETALPADERELVSSQLGLLKAKMRNEAQEHFMLAAVDSQRSLVGIVQYEFKEDLALALLWYFAVKQGLRSKGLGSQIYPELIARLASNGTRALIFEVEIPQEVKSQEERRLAERRIEFYRRLGVRLLSGVHYIQHIGWHQPPKPMYIMVHALQPLKAQAAYDMAKVFFEDAIEQTGPLALE